MALVVYKLCQSEYDTGAEASFPGLLRRTFIHLTVIGKAVGRAMTPHLEATFGRLHGHVLLHSTSAVEAYHGFVNGLLLWLMVAGSPCFLEPLDHGPELVQSVIPRLTSGYCFGVVIDVHAVQKGLEAVNGHPSTYSRNPEERVG